MGTSRWTPSIVPNGMDQTFYLVIDGFERGERLFRETPLDRADLEAVLNDLYDGQYNDPHRVLCFNPEEHWSQDVSDDIARELQKRIDRDGEARSVQSFIDLHLGKGREQQLALRLV